MRHPIGRGGDAAVITTLPNPPAEIINAYSRKLSSEMKTTQAPVSRSSLYAFQPQAGTRARRWRVCCHLAQCATCAQWIARYLVRLPCK